MNIARCGHGAYDHGHCAVPDCPNDYRACPDCNPASWPKRKEKEDVWEQISEPQAAAQESLL